MNLIPDIDRLTQIFSNAIAPAFFLGAVAAFVSLMMSRLAAVNESIKGNRALAATVLRLAKAYHLVRLRTAHACSVTASYCRWLAVFARPSCLRFFLQVSSLVCIMSTVRPFSLLAPLCSSGLRYSGLRRKPGMHGAN